jgi:hypothetical protein
VRLGAPQARTRPSRPQVERVPDNSARPKPKGRALSAHAWLPDLHALLHERLVVLAQQRCHNHRVGRMPPLRPYAHPHYYYPPGGGVVRIRSARRSQADCDLRHLLQALLLHAHAHTRACTHARVRTWQTNTCRARRARSEQQQVVCMRACVCEHVYGRLYNRSPWSIRVVREREPSRQSHRPPTLSLSLKHTQTRMHQGLTSRSGNEIKGDARCVITGVLSQV